MYEEFNWGNGKGKGKSYRIANCWLGYNDGIKVKAVKLFNDLESELQDVIKQDTLLFGELVPPDTSKVSKMEAVCVPIDRCFVEMGFSLSDPHRSLWLTGLDGSQFKIVSFLDSEDKEFLSNIFVLISFKYNEGVKAPLRQPIRTIVNAVATDNNGNYCSNLRLLHSNSVMLTLSGQLVSPVHGGSLSIRTYVNRLTYIIEASTSEARFMIQDVHGIWYVLKSYAIHYHLSAMSCLQTTARSLTSVFDWPVVQSCYVTRHVSHFTIVDDHGDMVDLDQIPKLHWVNCRVHLHGTLLPYDSPTASLHVSVSVVDYQVMWKNDKTVAAFEVIAVGGVHYRLNVPTHFAYSERMYIFHSKCNQIKDFLKIVSSLSVHQPNGGGMLCNTTLQGLQRDCGHRFDYNFVCHNADFVVRQLQQCVGLGKTDRLVMSVISSQNRMKPAAGPEENLDHMLTLIIKLVARVDAMLVIKEGKFDICH